MSRYATSYAMWQITREHDLAEQFNADPGAVLDGRDLTGAERDALMKQDLRTLMEFGIHPFVVYHFALRLAGGFSMPFMQDYLDQIAGLSVGSLET